MKVLGEPAPDFSRFGLDRAAVDSRHAEVLEAHVLTVEHAMHIVVGNDEQPRRIGEGRIVREPLRVGVAVRAEDRQPGDRSVEPARDVARLAVGGEQSVWV